MAKIYTPEKIEEFDTWKTWQTKFNSIVDANAEVINAIGDIDEFGGKTLFEYNDEKFEEMKSEMLALLIALS